MTKARLVSLEGAVSWRSRHATHVDRRYFSRVSLWRDILPADISGRLAVAASGDVVRAELAVGDVVDVYDKELVRRVQARQFKRRIGFGVTVTPRTGRFYPRNLVTDLNGFFSDDRRPLRCLSCSEQEICVDLNHPLSRFAAAVEIRLIEVQPSREEHGGQCNDVARELAEGGPGMQASLSDSDTDFFGGDPFGRVDPRPDSQFYESPRPVHHLDAAARARIAVIYKRYLRPGMRVLDLMSSWTSHLPEAGDGMKDVEVIGAGLNRTELERNRALSQCIVHDLNSEPGLPLPADYFDLAVCTASVEYLTHPIEVFRDVARTLKPGAPLIVTFSERWFPTKVIALWEELHPFERLGLMIDYFRLAGFGEIGSESIRGLPRPQDDQYADRLAFADPVFAAWGHKPGRNR